MRKGDRGEGFGAGSAPHHPGPPVAAGGAGGLFGRCLRALPGLALLAVCSLSLAAGVGPWDAMRPVAAMAGGSAPKAAPMQAEDAGSAARTGTPAPAEVRGAVAGAASDA
ncbi:transglutaminase, partial [Desulfovibrio sp. DS-1]